MTRFFLSRPSSKGVAGLLVFFWLVLAIAAAGRAELSRDEVVSFYPTQGYLVEETNRWSVPIVGWVREPGTLAAQALPDLFAGLFGRDWEPAEMARFRERVAPFLADNERGKTVEIRIAGCAVTVGPSTADGQLRGAATVPAGEAIQAGPGAWRLFQGATGGMGGEFSNGWYQLVPPTGLSVVSDIDDTLKVSHVNDFRELAANTFLRPFRAVPGMPEALGRWESSGAVFHYLSGSPWQLYEPLRRFFEAEGFPRGGFYLRTVRVNPLHLAAALESPGEYKRQWLETLLGRFPRRTFVLVGDSGEEDPEIYGQIAREHPGRVARVFIRDVTGEDRDAERYRRAFAGLATGSWALFRRGDDLTQSGSRFPPGDRRH